MKIIIATPLYPPEVDKLSIYSRKLASHLAKNHHLSVLTYANQVETDENIRLVRINKTQPILFRLFLYFWTLLKLSKNCDIIYTFNSAASSLPAILVKFLSKKPVLIDFFEDEAFKRASNLKLTQQSLEDFLKNPQANTRIKQIMSLQSLVLRQASKVVVSSQNLAKIISSFYALPLDKILLNQKPEDRKYNLPFDSDKVPLQLMLSNSLGNYSEVADVIGALGILKSKFDKLQLIIIGQDRDKNQLIKLSQKLALEKNIKFLGKVSRAEYWHILKSSQIYIHNFEDFDPDNKIVQSFLARTVVLAQDNHFNRELVIDSQNGLLFEKGKVEALSTKIFNLLNDSDLVRKLSDNSQVDLANIFSWSSHIDRLNRIFLSLDKK